MPVCPSCGKKTKSKEFCPHCGTKFELSAAAVSAQPKSGIQPIHIIIALVVIGLIIGALVVVVIAALIQMWAQVAILLAIDNQNAEPGVKNMLMTVAGIIFGPVATVYGYLIYRALQDQKMTPVAAPAPAMPASPPLIV